MFRYFRGKVQRWAAKEQRDELQYFVDMLKGADIGARAMVVAAATDFRNTIMQSEDFKQAQASGGEILFLHQFYRSLQTAEMGQVAAGVAVWIHTLRADKEISNLYAAKEMWALLAASFADVEIAAEDMALFMGGRALDIGGYDRIPIGFA